MSSARLSPRHLGYGVYWMWTLLCFQSTVAFLPLGGGLETVLSSHSEFFSFSLMATVVAHIVWALVLAARPKTCDHAPWACAVVSSASVAIVSVVPADAAAWLVALGLTSGFASAMLDVRWLQVMGHFEGSRSGRAICASICAALIGYQLLSMVGQLSQTACVVLIAVLPLISAAMLEACCRQDEGGMTKDQVTHAAHDARHIAASLAWPIIGSLAFFFVLGCVQGIASTHADFNELHMASLACEFVAVGLMYLALRAGLRMEVSRLYVLVMALVSAGFLALPIVINDGTMAGLFLTTILVSVGTMIIDVVVLCAIAHAAYDWQTSGALVGGLARGVTVGAMSVGHFAGNAMAETLWSGGVDVVVFVVCVTYLLILSCSLYLSHVRGAHGEGASSLAVGAHDVAGSGLCTEGADVAPTAAISTLTSASDTRLNQPQESSDEAFSARIEALAYEYHLSRRETDVFALLARGRSIPYAADALTISENTVRSHVRRIYDKLGVHSKQEVLDLVEKV